MLSRATRSSIHHLLGLPLGSLYLSLVAFGLLVGGALAVIGVGLLVLVATLWLARPLGELERRLANRLLDARIEAPADRPRPAGALAWARDVAADARTWRSLTYLLARFPLGIASFAATVALLGTGIGLAGAPVHYLAHDIDLGVWTVDTLPEALAVAPLGVALLFAAVPALAGLGSAQAAVARALLGRPASARAPRAVPATA